MSSYDEKAWHEKYWEILRRIEKFDREKGNGLLTKKWADLSHHFFTNRDVKFIPLDQRSGEIGREYFEYLNEESPDNPYDSYVAICNNNPTDVQFPPQVHFGHTWLHLNVSGANQVLQYYTTFEKQNLWQHLKSKGPIAAPLVGGLLLTPLLGPAVAAAGVLGAGFMGVYHSSNPAAPSSVHGQKSFHNALIIPLRRRQAEIMRVDAEIDKTGELGEYNFTNTLSRFRPGVSNCTLDAINRIEHVGIPIGKAIENAMPPYIEGENRHDFWGAGIFNARDAMWGVNERPGRLGRMINALKNTDSSNRYTVSAKAPDDEKDNPGTKFTLDECQLTVPEGKPINAIRVLTDQDHEKVMSVWHNLSDVLLELAEQEQTYVEGGRFTKEPTFDKEAQKKDLERTSIFRNGEFEKCRDWAGKPRTPLHLAPSPSFREEVLARRQDELDPSVKM